MGNISYSIDEELVSLTINMAGVLTASNSEKIIEYIQEKRKVELTNLVFNMHEAKRIDSAGISALLRAREKFVENMHGEGEFIIFSHGILREYLKKLKIDNFFDIQ